MGTGKPVKFFTVWGLHIVQCTEYLCSHSVTQAQIHYHPQQLPYHHPSKIRPFTKYVLYLERVPQCMYPCRNWDSPNPFIASECAPPPRTGGGHTCLRWVRGWGSPNSEKKLSTLPTRCVLFSTHLGFDKGSLNVPIGRDCLEYLRYYGVLLLNKCSSVSYAHLV
jgi:hypothetical protein